MRGTAIIMLTINVFLPGHPLLVKKAKENTIL
jgi:hypothetical protein